MTDKRPFLTEDLPPDDRRYLPIRRCRAGAPITGVALSERVVGCWQHWADGCTVACVEPREECAGCRLGHRRQWRGYIALMTAGRYSVTVVEITPETARVHGGRLLGGGRGIRGYAIRVYRRGGSSRGAVDMDIADHPARVAALPPPPDVAAAVLAMLRSGVES